MSGRRGKVFDGRTSSARATRLGRRSARPYQASVPVPPRKRLPHGVPVWVDPAKEIYFVTVCCRNRGANQLAIPHVGEPLIETIRHRNERGDWFAHLAMLMPDHVHLLLSFPHDRRVQNSNSKWKEWTAKTLAIEWQRDFFEHRLRRDESYRAKADYILMNPVRAGLVAQPEDWPFVLIG